MILAAETGHQSYYGWLSMLVLVAGGAAAYFTAWMSRRNNRDDNDTEKHQANVQEFGIVGDLAMQIADRVLTQTAAVQQLERHDCDEKIATLRQDFNEVTGELRQAVAECHEEREEFTRILRENGLLPEAS